MPDSRHHDPHIEGELVGEGLCEEVALKEHVGPFAELNNWASHASLSEGEPRRCIESDGVEVGDMADLVCALGSSVLAGQDISLQVDRDGVEALHGTLLVADLDGKPLDLTNGLESTNHAERPFGAHQHLQGLQMLYRLHCSTQHVVIDFDIFLSCRNRFVTSQGRKHPDVDAFEGQRGDKGPAGAVRSGSVQPSYVVKLEHDLAQTVGGKLFT